MECSENVSAPLGIEEAPAELAPMKQVVPDAPDVQEYEVVFVLRLWSNNAPLKNIVRVDLLFGRITKHVGDGCRNARIGRC